ncbi:restriction endonuclease PLD domain-containing protein [uncultured Alistipes sp.]|uniref:restriction endonuclease PLD domain-containing protein n=2 Tax=uncultured Alistipes sp. TaxID=538949 RepID=UPI00272D0875|nr:restriction endonuclease PLD domain-containing protein [uncultured Alistipes sp.]
MNFYYFYGNKVSIYYTMYIVDNITKNNHYSVIENLASSADEIILVSPFCVSDFDNFLNQVISSCSLKSMTFMTTLKRNEIADKTQSLLSFKRMATKYGIQNSILINNSLHGKIYIFKSNGVPLNALVTSANATHNGFFRNHEWGCCFDDKDQIDNLEKMIIHTAEYELTDNMLNDVKYRVDSHKQQYPTAPQILPPAININDIIASSRFNLNITPNTRIFLKPIGHTEDPVFDGNYSEETKQYFAKRPKIVRNDDLLISYGVGSRKIISVFQVLSNTPSNSEDTNSRWPWSVEVKNLTPKFAKVWFDKNLYITNLARDYVDIYDLPITNNGGKTLGALQWGTDKIQLTQDFGTELLSLVMTIEKGL